MILNIQSIERFGPFENFGWPDDLHKFCKKNIIFGWNASGKTSLSRLLACLQHKKIVPGDEGFENAVFSITLDGDAIVSQNNFDPSPEIRVYNRDFVDREFSFDDTDKSINAINIVMSEGSKQDLQRYNDAKEFLKEKKEAMRKTDQEYTKTVQVYNDFIAEKAGAVRKALGISGNRFNRNRFEYTLEHMKKDADSRLLVKEKGILLKEMAIEAKPSLDKKLRCYWESIESFHVFMDSAKKILAQELVQNALEGVSDDSTLNKWLQDGLGIHEGKDRCEFCGGPLLQTRMDQLRKAFSGAYKALQDAISESLEEAREGLGSIQSIVYDKHTFDETLIAEFETAENEYIKAATVFRERLTQLKKELEEKKANVFAPREFESQPWESAYSKLASATQNIHVLVEKHNGLQKDIDGRKRLAFDRLVQDESGQYLGDYYKLKERMENNENERLKTGGVFNKARGELREARKLVVQPAKGADKVNEYMQYLLCSNTIELIHSDDTGGYRLMRRGAPAKHLSEGEKTAITFAYFMATLEDESVDLDNTVVVVDDPVSSLDSNKVHATYGLIADKIWDKCLQLFILSHHFQFIKLFHGPVKNGETGEMKIAWFVMEGGDAGPPVLKRCPSLITNFQSEYYYLFYRLHDFVKHEENFYIARNILRRFLEALLEFKYGCGDFRGKLDKWFDSERRFSSELFGVLNAGSHPNEVNDFTDPRRFRELVYRVCKSIKEKDLDHHNALARHLNRDLTRCRLPADGSICTSCALLTEIV